MTYNTHAKGLSKLNRRVLSVLGPSEPPYSEFHTDLIERVVAQDGFKRIDVLNALVRLESWGYIRRGDGPARDTFWTLTGKSF